MNLRIAAEVARVLAQRLHRFLISSPDLGIDARISPKTTFCVHRFLISGLDLRIDASFSPETSFCVHRFLISRPDLRIDAAPSLLQLRMARLQRSRRAQAGTGCHEGGIILRKSRRSGTCPCRNNAPRPILIFVAAKENSPPAAQSWGAGRDRMPRRRHNPK